MIEFLTSPWEYSFWLRAFLVALMSGAVCGVIGSHVVLRGMSFIGDAVAHAVFPGVAVSFVLGANLVLGGAVAGVVTAVLVAVFSQNRRLKEDSVIGVFFAGAFGLGIVILSTAPGYGGSLESFLFGSILGIADADVRNIAVIGAGLLLVALLVHKELVTVGLDRESARAMGLPVFALDLLLYVMVTLAIVVSLQAVGNILVLALLITPAATARLLTDRLGTMMLLAPALGGLGSLAGLYASYALNLAAGGMIVLVLTGMFLLTWFTAPRHGLVSRLVRRRRRADAPAPGTHVDSAEPGEGARAPSQP
ncbi:anchored repeat-type ABC transporter permease subunit [Nocardiopsis alborubida]|uniref:Anchored repeat-type ABC transporter permease subunit n=1 Tax=Nocardiopsis alborubida TaxID=146802 RepID=A0A7X6MIK1_9ACTN|nr:anchored repeat-type ABC transporter permease subunit [Nocardiopsis alborubida]NKZ00424.1 anchored repeat-type ABC transporter permease subunit [Nocardiopsis alborubida]